MLGVRLEGVCFVRNVCKRGILLEYSTILILTVILTPILTLIPTLIPNPTPNPYPNPYPNMVLKVF